MIKVNQDLCTGCGACVRDCFAGDMELTGGKAAAKNSGCFRCGHCIAVCPAGAVRMTHSRKEDIVPFPDGIAAVEAEGYLDFLRSRRSVRQFTAAPVSDADISKIIESGRLSPTGGNRQDTVFCVVREHLPELREMVLRQLNSMAETVRRQGPTHPDYWYTGIWERMYRSYFSEAKRDELFFNAPAAVLVLSKTPLNGAIAAAHMETMVYALELGMVYSGFATTAATASGEIRTMLSIPEGYHVVTCMVIGHPKVRYYRSVPRNEAQIIQR